LTIGRIVADLILRFAQNDTFRVGSLISCIFVSEAPATVSGSKGRNVGEIGITPNQAGHKLARTVAYWMWEWNKS
jgi:hypothetical protein